jgi:nitrile hydratase subunit alpha
VEQYAVWSYYEKWTAAMVTLLLERHVLTELELRNALFGPAELLPTAGGVLPPRPLFGTGDLVRVKPYGNNVVEWRRPHLRTPGYVYGAMGTIERVCGCHSDPSYLAFGMKPAPEVQLYRVQFRHADLWPERRHRASSSSSTAIGDHDDVVEVEIYEHWLESAAASPSSSNMSPSEPIALLFDHGEKGGDDCIIGGPHHHHHHQDQHHDHDHEDAVHDARPVVEERAVRNEGPPRPGQDLFQALLNVLLEKEIVRADDIRAMCETLDTAGQRLDGATLVVAAWLDEAFRQRLLDDPAAAAAELGILTSNANAPTVLTVVPNQTNQVHNLIVCTLCSCYPSGLLGIAPTWYKSRLYRAHAVRYPRAVLASFGTVLPDSTMIRVHDSTADHRYLVLPDRPIGTENWSAEQLRALVTRDSMIGVTVPTVPPP